MNALPVTLNEFVDEGKYRQIVQDMLKMADSLGASQAEVGLSASIGLNVNVRMKEVDTLEFNRDKSIGITVYINQSKGSAGTSDIHPDSLRATVEAAIRLAKLTEQDPFSGLAEPQQMASTFPNLQLYHPWKLSVEEAIDLAKTCEAHAFEADPRIQNSEGASINSSQTFRVYGNSHGFLGAYPSSRHSISCTVIAETPGKGLERDYDYTTARDPNQLTEASQIGRSAAHNTISRLHARKIPTQKVPVIFHAKVATSLWNHFLSAISGGRLFRKTSFLHDALHQKVFPEHIHLFERPHLLGGLASANYDSDGVATSDKDFVRDGVVQNYVLGAYSARKLNLPNTGNASGVHNLRMSHSDLSLNDLLKKMGRGLLVTELMGQGVNLVTGNYSRGASGFWIEEGQIQFPVNEITIAGQLGDMFQDCLAIGNDIDPRYSIHTGSVWIREMMVAGN